MSGPMDIDRLLAGLKAWAEEQADVSMVLLVGSHARGTARADSDVDLVILSSEPKRYLDPPAFAECFGSVAQSKKENWGRVTSIRVFYQDGLEVEFGFAKPDWASLPLDGGTARTLRDGFKIIFARDGDLAGLESE